MERARLRPAPRRDRRRGRRTATTIGYAHFRGGDLLAVVDPTREGEGAGTALLEWAETRATAQRGDDHAAPGRRRPAARARAALLEAHGYEVARSYYRLERDARPATRSRRACARCTPDDAPALYALHEAAFSGRPDHTHAPRGGVDPARVRRPLASTSTSAGSPTGRASRSPAAGRTTPPTSRCSPSHPDHAGHGLGTQAAAGRVRRRGRVPGIARSSSTSPPTTRARCASTSASA